MELRKIKENKMTEEKETRRIRCKCRKEEKEKTNESECIKNEKKKEGVESRTRSFRESSI